MTKEDTIAPGLDGIQAIWLEAYTRQHQQLVATGKRFEGKKLVRVPVALPWQHGAHIDSLPTMYDPEHPVQTKGTTAFHEAGHAVIARVLTLATGRATISTHDQSNGHIILHNQKITEHAWEICGKVRAPDVALHAQIIATMAGAETEAVLLRRKSVGDGHDRASIALLAEQLCASPPWNRLEPRLRAMTRMLVQRHRGLIERTARTLLKKTSLSTAQLDKLIKRNVADLVRA